MAKRDLISQVIWIVTLLLGVIALRVWYIEPLTIKPDMVNQGVIEKDLVLVAKQGDLEYGDLIAYRVSNQTYVGRLIGKSGDKVVYMDDVLYRNDQVVHEPYIKNAANMEYTTQDMSVLTLTEQQMDTIPERSYLLLNDNRSNTKDSREFGLVKQEQLIGRLSFRLTPLKTFGFIERLAQ